MSTPLKRGPLSRRVQGWVTPDQDDVLSAVADRLTERTGRPHKAIDALRWLLDRGPVKSFAEGKRPSV